LALNEVAQWKSKRALETEGSLLEATGFAAEELQELFGKMLLVRRFEEAVEQAFRREEVGGYVHLYNRQEAVATGFPAHRRRICAFGLGVGYDHARPERMSWVEEKRTDHLSGKD
jgi:TPP-dependent pyruvate/acetoin dehydrogenase alpha subunit